MGIIVMARDFLRAGKNSCVLAAGRHASVITTCGERNLCESFVSIGR